MFTFGRNHEVDHALRRYGSKETAKLLVSVIDAVNDLIENRAALESAELTIKCALTDGKSGIWEQAGGWLLKVNQDFPSSINVWRELVATADWTQQNKLRQFPTRLAT